MPRDGRLDFKGAIHYASVRGGDGSDIFFDDRQFRQFPRAAGDGAPRVLRFELLLAASCDECGAVLHAYCLEPNSGILVLRTTGAPLHALMQRLCGSYSRYLRDGGFSEGPSVFSARYKSKVVAPDYLPHAVRRAHRSPIVHGLCRRRVDYPFSSERAYIGERLSLPVDVTDLKSALEQKGHSGPRGYREFMDREETPFVANLLSNGSALDSRIIGDRTFVQQVRYRAAHPPRPPSQEQLIQAVARLLNKTPADMLSATHVGVLGRALVAWYGQRVGAATLTEMGQWFSVTGATLGQSIAHYRRVAPALFRLATLPGLEDGAGE